MLYILALVAKTKLKPFSVTIDIFFTANIAAEIQFKTWINFFHGFRVLCYIPKVGCVKDLLSRKSTMASRRLKILFGCTELLNIESKLFIAISTTNFIFLIERPIACHGAFRLVLVHIFSCKKLK